MSIIKWIEKRNTCLCHKVRMWGIEILFVGYTFWKITQAMLALSVVSTSFSLWAMWAVIRRHQFEADIWDSHSCTAEDGSVLGCDAVLLVLYCLHLQGQELPVPSWTAWLQNIKAPCAFKTWGTTFPKTQCHILADLNLKPYFILEKLRPYHTDLMWCAERFWNIMCNSKMRMMQERLHVSDFWTV